MSALAATACVRAGHGRLAEVSREKSRAVPAQKRWRSAAAGPRQAPKEQAAQAPEVHPDKHAGDRRRVTDGVLVQRCNQQIVGGLQSCLVLLDEALGPVKVAQHLGQGILSVVGDAAEDGDAAEGLLHEQGGRNGQRMAVSESGTLCRLVTGALQPR